MDRTGQVWTTASGDRVILIVLPGTRGDGFSDRELHAYVTLFDQEDPSSTGFQPGHRGLMSEGHFHLETYGGTGYMARRLA